MKSNVVLTPKREKKVQDAVDSFTQKIRKEIGGSKTEEGDRNGKKEGERGRDSGPRSARPGRKAGREMVRNAFDEYQRTRRHNRTPRRKFVLRGS